MRLLPALLTATLLLASCGAGPAAQVPAVDQGQFEIYDVAIHHVTEELNWIRGQITNHSSYSYSVVIVEIELYDEQNRILTVVPVTILGLPAGQTRAFEGSAFVDINAVRYYSAYVGAVQ